MALVCIDYREEELLRILLPVASPFTPSDTFTASPSLVQSAPLPVGDIWIGVREEKATEEKATEEKATEEKATEEKAANGGLVIERKRMADFEASFLDGRYREQRGRILAFCQAHHAQPVYLIEGPFSAGTGRLPKKTLMKLLNRLLLRYQIPIVHTQSVKESAEWIQATAEQWKEDATALQRTQEKVSVSDGLHIQKKQNASDPRLFAMACVAQCPGVSVKMAESLVGTYPSLTALLQLTAKEIEQHKVGARKIGPVVSQRLYALLHSE
jgi:ERCC4-type nuclease